MDYRTRLTGQLFFYFIQMAEKDKKKIKKKRPIAIRISRWKIRLYDIIDFLTYDIWRIESRTISRKTSIFYNSIKTLIMTVRKTMELDLGSRAASLTYRTVLSIVPFLAVLFAIARGFGFENIIQSEIFNYLGIHQMENSPEGQSTFIAELINSINKSLEYARGSGIFAGVGVVLLLYTVFTLFKDIEKNFNRIWQIKKGRSTQRQISGYFALMLLIPIMIILNYGITIFLNTPNDNLKIFANILNPIFAQILNILPFVLTILVLTLLYKFMPNTKVKFVNAFIAAIITGTIYQVFQIIYLSGQIWITKYNAIYGTFAAIPLLLLWIQLSWYVILVGVELAFSAQNVRKFNFDKETRNISRRYRDFFTLLITTEIVKSFMDEKPPLTSDEISSKCKVPIGLTNRIIDDLQGMKIISPTPSENDLKVMSYQPSLDINMISINYLLKKIDSYGSEDFNIDTEGDLNSLWNVFMETRMNIYESNRNILLKDL